MSLDFLMSADRLLQVASVAAYVLGLAVALRLVWVSWRRADAAAATLAALLENRSRDVRRTARRTLSLRREAELVRRRAGEVEAQNREIEERLDASRGERRPVFVFSELKRPGDRLFQAEVRHTAGRPVPEPFKDGARTYAVWASDERRAHARLAGTYRDEAGYTVSVTGERERMPRPI